MIYTNTIINNKSPLILNTDKLLTPTEIIGVDKIPASAK